MSGSRSQTPTISHPLIRWIWDAWASAIFPQPTIATLSMIGSDAIATEVAVEPLGHGYAGPPTQSGLQLVVAIPRPLPVGVPAASVKGGRKLFRGPLGILLPQVAQAIAHRV